MKKNIFKFYHTFLMSSLAVFVVAGCSHGLKRDPAGSTVVVKPAPNQIKLISDFFASSNDHYRFIIDRRFSTDKDKAYLSEKAQKSLHQAFSTTFLQLDQEGNVKDTSASLGAMLGKLKGNITGPLVANFAKTLEVFKVIDTDVKYDLIFSPEMVTDNYASEFSSNDLSPLWMRGQLASQLSDLKENHQLVQVKKLAQSLSNTNPDQAFLGGAISLKAKLAKVNLFKKGAFLFSGTITYRRYFLENAQGQGQKFKTVAGKPVISTIDVIYTLDAKAIKPSLSRVIIYPGQLIATQDLSAANEVEKFAELRRGDFEIKRLVYDAEKERIDLSQSDVKVHDFYPQSEEFNAEENKVREFVMKNTDSLKRWVASYGMEGGAL